MVHYSVINNDPQTVVTLKQRIQEGIKPTHLYKVMWVRSLVEKAVGDSFCEKLYRTLNPDVNPECKQCGGSVKFYHKNFCRGYQTYCSCRCKAIDQKSYLNGQRVDVVDRRKKAAALAVQSRTREQQQKITTKVITTKIQRYGVDFDQKISLKQKKTMLGDFIFNLLYSSPKFLHEQYVLDNRSMIGIARQLNISDNAVKTALLYHSFDIRQKKSTSYLESFVEKFLNKNEIKFVKNDRMSIKPYEFDFYLPHHRVAIEVCGLYWHSCDNQHVSDNRRLKTYHQQKFMKANQNNITLITLFEDEILNMPDKIESRLSHILHISTERYFARGCVLRDIDKQTAQQFLNQYHTQSSKVGTINKGLFYQDILVACATFGKPRYTKQHDLELLRFATRGSVVGGLSKLVKSVGSRSIISYSDNRWGTGRGYAAAGFNKDAINPPSYFYFKKNDPSKKYHRSSFMKHKLGINREDTRTEVQVMLDRGFMRIFDCGTTRWIFDNNQF